MSAAEEAAVAFRSAWEAANERGEAGARTDAGISAVAPILGAAAIRYAASEVDLTYGPGSDVADMLHDLAHEVAAADDALARLP